MNVLNELMNDYDTSPYGAELQYDASLLFV